jgi:hypothetical protein
LEELNALQTVFLSPVNNWKLIEEMIVEKIPGKQIEQKVGSMELRQKIP